MIIFLPVIVGLGLGWVSGGRLGNLARLSLRYAWLPVCAFVLQAALVVYSSQGGAAARQWKVATLIVTYAALLAFLVLHRRVPGALFLLLGAGLNSIVMFANGGFMPVTWEALVRAGHEGHVVTSAGRLFVEGSKDVVLSADDTRLRFLSDVVGIPEPSPFAVNFSIGDVLIGVGAVVLLRQAMLAAGQDRPAQTVLRVGADPG
jgi:hypothetical protein